VLTPVSIKIGEPISGEPELTNLPKENFQPQSGKGMIYFELTITLDGIVNYVYYLADTTYP
jgi:hypothetical protein